MKDKPRVNINLTNLSAMDAADGGNRVQRAIAGRCVGYAWDDSMCQRKRGEHTYYCDGADFCAVNPSDYTDRARRHARKVKASTTIKAVTK